MKSEFNWEGFKPVEKGTFGVPAVTLTIDRQMRLSPAAFMALGEPEYVRMTYNANARRLSVRKASAEEADAAGIEEKLTECCGAVRTAHVISHVKPFRRMLLQELNGKYRYRIPGEQRGQELEFSLHEAVAYVKTHAPCTA